LLGALTVLFLVSFPQGVYSCVINWLVADLFE
jgi:hypothetical protein